MSGAVHIFLLHFCRGPTVISKLAVVIGQGTGRGRLSSRHADALYDLKHS